MDSDPDFDVSSDGSLASADSSSDSSQGGANNDDEEYEAERAAEFDEDIRRLSRNLIFVHLENQLVQQGQGRRQASQTCGQLMRSLAELPLANIRNRLEPRLSAQSRGILNAQLNMLHRHWRQDRLQNDRRFVEVMGGQDDPNRSRLEQYFNMLLHNDSLTSGLSGEASRMVQAAISRYTRTFMYLRFFEFSLRTLSTNGRRSFLEWITTCRLRDRHARESQLM